MKNTTTENTEALLEGLIAECHGIVRDLIRPEYARATAIDRSGYIHAVSALADSAVKLGDAIGRLRGPVPAPEVRQRITVEKVQVLPPGKRAAVPQLSAPQGEGDS
jgi:hypothetical protein